MEIKRKLLILNAATQIFPQTNREKSTHRERGRDRESQQEDDSEQVFCIFRIVFASFRSTSNASLICSVIYDNVHFYAPQCVCLRIKAAENELYIR